MIIYLLDINHYFPVSEVGDLKKSTTLKADRVLYIYMRLLQGEILHKKALAEDFHVTVRSIQRDISVLRCALAEQNMGQDIISDTNGYRLQNVAENASLNVK